MLSEVLQAFIFYKSVLCFNPIPYGGGTLVLHFLSNYYGKAPINEYSNSLLTQFGVSAKASTKKSWNNFGRIPFDPSEIFQNPKKANILSQNFLFQNPLKLSNLISLQKALNIIKNDQVTEVLSLKLKIFSKILRILAGLTKTTIT